MINVLLQVITKLGDHKFLLEIENKTCYNSLFQKSVLGNTNLCKLVIELGYIYLYIYVY